MAMLHAISIRVSYNAIFDGWTYVAYNMTLLTATNYLFNCKMIW
jgi:hypothetical protein